MYENHNPKDLINIALEQKQDANEQAPIARIYASTKNARKGAYSEIGRDGAP